MIRKPQLFLCYARQDESKVKDLYQRLLATSYKPWMDKEDILAGEDWKYALKKAIRESHFFLACLSANSVDKRGVIQIELKEALEIWDEKIDSDIYIIPIRLEECNTPENLRRFQYVNLFEEDGWSRLTKSLNDGVKRLGIIILRSQALDELSRNDIKSMLKEKDFFDNRYNLQGNGVQHQYELKAIDADKLVIDHATGLMWQQSGSKVQATYGESHKYIRELNNICFAGCNDWRLPTLEEAMSLMESQASSPHALYINPIFDSYQQQIWTIDRINGRMKFPTLGTAWLIDFFNGICETSDKYYDPYVRAVRSVI